MTLASRSLVVLLALIASTVSVAQPTHLVQIGVADSVASEVLGEQRGFWVHLPNGGDLREGHRYPVLYLLDGGSLLATLAAVQEAYTPFRMPEMIVVAVSNRSHRTRDLTTSLVASRQGAAVEESGGAEAFTRFLAEELIPYIDDRYPTSDHRTLIGHSYAGLFAIHTLVHHGDLFTNYIAIDPSLDWDDQRLLREAMDALTSGVGSGKGLYVSLANEIIRFSDTLTIEDVAQDTTEFSLGVRSTLAFVQAVEASPQSGLRFSWGFYEQDIHGSVPLISMRDGLVFLYDWWELKRPSRYNDPSTPTKDIVALIRAQSEALTANLGEPMAMDEELLTMLGYMAMDMGQPEKAGAIFALLGGYYPESADAHTALSEFFEAQDDISQALRHAQEAFALSGSDEHRTRVEALTSRR